MMKNHTGDKKEFYILDPDRTFSDTPCLMIGFYSPGGTSGEFAIRWRDIGERERIARLEVYNDGWSALANMPELLTALPEIDGSNPSIDTVVTLLKKLGFEEYE